MGQVFLAEQSSLRRLVALKLIKPDSLSSATAIKRFRLEAEAIARINHPGIVQVFAVGQSSGVPTWPWNMCRAGLSRTTF